MFLKRSSKEEMMDDLFIIDNRIKEALDELHTINKYLGGIAVTKKGLKQLLNNPTAQIKILDIGGGGSDVLSDLKNKNKLDIYSIDINKFSCHYQKKQHPDNNIVCADATALPVKESSFDIVHASLFLHHFSGEEIIKMLRCFMLISKRGVIVNDLRRNILAYAGIRVLTMLFSRSTFVKNDGPLSVWRAFTKKELVLLLNQAGIEKYTITRMWAFRFLIVIPTEQNE